MSRIPLPGCRSGPLGSYLQGLGAWRALVRTADPDVLAQWGGGCLVLTTALDRDAMVSTFTDRFSPLPIVSPWNAGSGFAGNSKNVEAEKALAAVRATDDERLAPLRAAVAAADAIVAEGRARGWGGAKGELWDAARKPAVLTLCRNLLPDDALPWLDTAAVLGQDGDPAYNRLLGTGGNFGRQDLSATYVRRALTVLADPRGVRQSEGWLRAALFADESVPYLRDTVGQFDPGRAGGIQSSPWEKQDDRGFANPWSLLLTIEGAVMFAGAVVRRQGAQMSRAAVPFTVRTTTAGFGTTAVGETAHAELWTPEWGRPASLGEVEHLLAEGRVEWNGHPAHTGVDFVRAVAALGVDRGITHFTRHVFVERLGQNPLAVPVDRVAVRHRGSVGLLSELDGWLDSVRRASPTAAVEARMRQVEAALYTVAQDGDPDAFRRTVVALGRLHDAVSRSGTVRARVKPLILRRAAEWWQALAPDSAELRIAVALASASDAGGTSGSLRLLLTPVQNSAGGRWLEWSLRRPEVAWGASTVSALAEAHRRRALPGVADDPAERPDAEHRPAVRGILSAYSHGLEVPLSDLDELAGGRVDDELLGGYLRGLLLLDWSDVRAADRSADRSVITPALALLVPFFAVKPLRVRLRPDAEFPTSLVLRPGAQWIATLRATGPAVVLSDAVRRLRAAGIAGVVAESAVARTSVSGEALAAALLLRVAPAARLHALRQIAVLPQQARTAQPTEGAVA